MEKQSPFLRLWELGESEHSGLIRAMISAAAGVLSGMLPYDAAAQIIIALLGGNREWTFYLSWCAAGLIGYALRACLYALALSMSHKATFTILKNIRGKILDKLPKLPLGTIVDTSSGKLKQIIVDQVESMETPLAHLLPEMTGNLFGPVCILIYLFVLDWRMALLSGLHPGGNAVYDAGYDRLWGEIRGFGQDRAGDELHYCGIHRRD